MKKTRFTESQIIGILKQQESGQNVNTICREHGISQATFYNWKSKYSGLEVNQLKKTKKIKEKPTQKQEWGYPSFQTSLRSHTHAFLPTHS